MSISTNILSDRLPSEWGIQRIIADCAHCHASLLILESDLETLCPICFQGNLKQSPSLFRSEPPERIIPAKIDSNRINPLLDKFVNEVKMRCDDFSTQQLINRMKLLYLPMWLVDATINGQWHASAGFPQHVKSSVEKFSNGSWQSQDVIEKKLRWEKRMGEISRRYDNIAVLASTNFKKIFTSANNNEFDLNQSTPYSPSLISNDRIAVPNIEPDVAWQNAQPSFEKLVYNDVVIACAADQIQDYHLNPNFSNLNWTQVLLPVLTTYYLDDDGQYQVIMINGQTGTIKGKRIASQRKGFLYAGIAFTIALATFLLGLGAFAIAPIIPPISFLGLLFIPIAVIATIIAGYFMVLPWSWNRAQNQQDE
jgi:hypothetical protein